MFNSWFYVGFDHGSCYPDVNKCSFDVLIVG